jgi:hypothetical protein
MLAVRKTDRSDGPVPVPDDSLKVQFFSLDIDIRYGGWSQGLESCWEISTSSIIITTINIISALGASTVRPEIGIDT